LQLAGAILRTRAPPRSRYQLFICWHHPPHSPIFDSMRLKSAIWAYLRRRQTEGIFGAVDPE
jgi:hypothetical protein